MLLSIITVNYNNRLGLEQTIQSISNQEMTDYEWIVIDGDSSDGSKDVLEHHSDLFSYWVSEQDGGIYNAMNKGIAQATGDYCLFMNSGDLFADAEVLQRVIPHLQDKAADILCGDALMTRVNGKARVNKAPVKMHLHYLTITSLCHQATFIRTSLLKNEGYDERYRLVADWKHMFQCFMNGAVYRRLPFAVCRYDVTGISSVNIAERETERLQALYEMLPHALCDALLYLDADEVERKRRTKIEWCFHKGGKKGMWKLLRNSFKWLMAEIF